MRMRPAWRVETGAAAAGNWPYAGNTGRSAGTSLACSCTSLLVAGVVFLAGLVMLHFGTWMRAAGVLKAMSEFEAFQRVGLAVCIGLLVGIERGWQEREARDGARVAGIRTFTLIGVLGALCGLLSQVSADAVLGYCFLGFALCFGAFEWRKARIARNFSATNMVAGLLTFVLGACAVRGSMAVAAAAGVATTAVLAERQVLHTFLRHLKWVELRAALTLLIMTAVLLPALPDRPIDPWGALNPHSIWLMTVLIGAGVLRWLYCRPAGGRTQGSSLRGPDGRACDLHHGHLDFCPSRTQTIRSLSPPFWRPFWPHGSFHCCACRLLPWQSHPSWRHPLLPPIAASAFIILIPAVLLYRIAARSPAHNLVLQDPFELSLMLRFTALLAVIMLLAKLLSAMPGQYGLLALGGASGLLDVDPITLSMAGLVRTGPGCLDRRRHNIGRRRGKRSGQVGFGSGVRRSAPGG